MNVIRIPIPWTTVFATSTTVVVLPVGLYRACAGVERARGVVELRGATATSLFVAPYLQFVDAMDQTTPTSVLVSAATNTDGVTYPTDWTTTTVANGSKANQLLRPALGVSLSTGTDLAVGRVGGYIELATS